MDFVGFVEQLIFDSFKDYMQNINDDKRVKKLIANYIKRKEKEFKCGSLSEEIDFEGFCICLKESLIFDIRKCIMSPGSDQNRLMTQIINKAVESSYANNAESKHKVEIMVSNIMEIMYDFYREYKLDEGTLVLAGEIEKLVIDKNEEILKNNDENVEKIINTVKATEEKLFNEIGRSSNSKLIDKLSYIDRYIENKKENVMNQSLFPWFKHSLKYREVFPKLFIEPILKEKNNTLFFADITSHKRENISILGEAGAGKSTLLRYTFAFSLINDIKCIYITANEAYEKNSILDTIIEVVSETSNEQYLVLIDGIDEKFAYDYEGFTHFIVKLQSAVNIKFWLGCRTDFYDKNYNENMAFMSHNFLISSWKSDQINSFIDQYSIICGKTSIREYVEKLIGDDEVVRQFITNPFMLSLLVFLAENNEKSRIRGIYDLYERFIQKWLETEIKRKTTNVDKKTVINYLRDAANQIYCGKEYIIDEIAENNSAIRNLLIIEEKDDIYGSRYSTAFYHRSIADFLIAENLLNSFLYNKVNKIKILLNSKRKDDVTNFVGSKFSVLSDKDKNTIKTNLVSLYDKTCDTDISVREQLIYYITRLGIDVTDFLEKIVDENPTHLRIRLSIAYGCVLSESTKTRKYALNYAKAISEDSDDAIANRAWTVIYFGDVNDRDPYTYLDDEKRSWKNARKARIKRFTKKEPRLKDFRFRLFDIPLFYSFLKDREWEGISKEEYDIILKTEFPKNVFNDEEIAFLEKEKTKLLNDYRAHLNF